MKNMKITLLVWAVILVSAGYARADGLDSLIEVGRSQGEIAKAYSEETKAYESVKRAVIGGQIVKGLDKKAVLNKYGEPVVAVGVYGTDKEKWIYKPATSDFSKGPKVSLFFAKNGTLDDIAVDK